MAASGNKFLDAALRYIDMGFKVVILGKQSKETISRWTPNGLLDATTDPDKARAWWELTPKCNVAIVCGETAEPGKYLTVIDWDVDSDNGIDSVHDVLVPWEKEHGELPETVTEITGRGGLHYFYYTDRPIPKCENHDIHVDIRGVGSYAMVAPSVHPNGNVVEWENHPDDYEIAWADDNVYSLIDKILETAINDDGTKPKVNASGGLTKGSRNTDLYAMASGFMSQSWDDEAITFAINSYNSQANEPLPQQEVDKLLRSALKLPKGKSAEWYKNMGIQPESDDFTKLSDVRKMLSYDRSGTPMKTIVNCMAVLANDPNLKGRFGYNEIAYSKTIECPVPWDKSTQTRQIKDVDYSQFAAYLEKNYGIIAKDKAIDAVANICSFNRYNPITEWLDSLVWDGESRIRGLLPLYLGCEESDYNTEVISLFMRGAIARAYEPGCKFDYMIVLVGKQGIGKSTFLRRLAHQSSWFNDNFNTIEGDSAVEKIRGMWISEMAELLSLKGAQNIEAIKAFVTTRVDTIRPKYARETEQRPRICVFAGTTNSFDFLSDPTGNRRFIPVHCLADECQELLFEESSQEFFDQCWAEVYHDWKNGDRSLELSTGTAAIAERMREQHTEDDPRVGMICQYIDGQIQSSSNPEILRFGVSEILNDVLQIKDYKNPSRKLVNEIHSILRNQVPGLSPYDGNGGKARTRYGRQKAYIVDLNHPHVTQLRGQRPMLGDTLGDTKNQQ